MSRSVAECSGYLLMVELADGADDATVQGVLEAVSRGARVLTGEDARAQLEARRRGEPWVTAAETRALSYIEGRMVAARVSTGVAAALGLTPEDRTLLAEAVREEMFTHVERLHAGLASPGRFFQDWPALAERIAARCACALESCTPEALRAALVDHFAGEPRS